MAKLDYTIGRGSYRPVDEGRLSNHLKFYMGGINKDNEKFIFISGKNRFEINFEEKIIRPIKAEDDERKQNYYDECKEVWERRTIKEINEHAAYNMGQFLYRFANRNFSGMQMRPWYKMIDGAQIVE